MRRKTTSFLALIALVAAGLFFVACGSSDAGTDDDHDDTAAAADDGHDDTDADADHEEEDLFAQDAHVTIEVEMIDIAFAQPEITIEAGELVEIALTNTGVVDHDFTIEEIHTAHAYHDPTEEAAGHDEHGSEYAMHHALVPGDSVLMRVIAEEPGTYEFYCTVPGHKEAGMVGTLTVQG
ncbi:MAG: multicopper oxidase domain-containing protein [Dehalococcoidia bacterium]|nr:multicopper oxidase domain-containing protein [Dehalococcoidia bacterium]